MAGEGWELLLGERCQHIPVSLPLVFVPFNTPQMYPCLPGGVRRVYVNQLKLKLVTSYESFSLDVSELGVSGRGGHLHPKAALRNDSGCAGRRGRGLLVPGTGKGNQCPLARWAACRSSPRQEGLRLRTCSFGICSSRSRAESASEAALLPWDKMQSPASPEPCRRLTACSRLYPDCHQRKVLQNQTAAPTKPGTARGGEAEIRS